MFASGGPGPSFVSSASPGESKLPGPPAGGTCEPPLKHTWRVGSLGNVQSRNQLAGIKRDSPW